jgi:UDP-3-O-[3-hydroxymyristoyl] glucosamine N-acyltransferase
MSPLARVHPSAQVIGPALVGPGCVVERGAQLGADVVLTRNVVVGSGMRLARTVVLPDRFIHTHLQAAGRLPHLFGRTA